MNIVWNTRRQVFASQHKSVSIRQSEPISTAGGGDNEINLDRGEDRVRRSDDKCSACDTLRGNIHSSLLPFSISNSTSSRRLETANRPFSGLSSFGILVGSCIWNHHIGKTQKQKPTFTLLKSVQSCSRCYCGAYCTLPQ